MLINNLTLKIICMIMVGNLTVEADAGDEVSMGDFIMGFWMIGECVGIRDECLGLIFRLGCCRFFGALRMFGGLGHVSSLGICICSIASVIHLDQIVLFRIHYHQVQKSQKPAQPKNTPNTRHTSHKADKLLSNHHQTN